MPFYQGYAPGMPGIGSTVYSRGRQIWLGLAGVQYLPIGGAIWSQASRDPDNFESAGNETEPETPPTSSTATDNIFQPPNAVGTVAPTSSVPGYSGVLRAGLLMGRVTNQGGTATFTGSGGFYRPSVLGILKTAVTGATTSVSVTPQCAFEVAREITANGGNVNLTIIGYDSQNSVMIYQSITATAATQTATTGTLTTSSFTPGSSANILPGAFICPRDGSQFPVTFIDEQFGLNVVDNFGNSLTSNTYTANTNLVYAAPFPRLPIAGGAVNVLNIVNYPSAALNNAIYGTANYTATQLALFQAWVKAQLNSAGQVTTSTTSPVNYGGRYTFSDDFNL
jgi:hypothetical protein